MIRINLLPVREWRKKEEVRQQISIYLLSIVLLLCIFLGIAITIQQKVEAKQDKLTNLQTQIVKLNKIKTDINKINIAKKRIKERFNIIEKLQANRQITVKLLDQLITVIPIDRLSLTHISFKNRSLHVSGIALDNHTVALYMKRLENIPMFQTVELLNTQRRNINGHDLMAFRLNISIKSNSPISKSKKNKK